MGRVAWTTRVWIALAVFLASALPLPVSANLANPAWFDPAWHYRVPVTLPAAAAVNSTIVVNADFNAALGQLGIATASVDFDEASPRIVRPNGLAASRQEFSDRVFALALDAGGNGRGEIRFLLQDGPAAGVYWLYFDIAGNGVKPANPATPINGNFEQSVGAVPTGWVTSALNAGGAQHNEVYRTALGSTVNVVAGCATGVATASTSPASVAGVATGQAWHLLGYRTSCEDGTANETIRLSRDIAVPLGAAAGTLSLYFQVQGWDGISNATNYDWVVFYVNGTAVNHTTLGINNAPVPQLRIDTNRLGRSAYSATYLDHGWKVATMSLAPYAGSTINFRIETRHSSADNDYRSWLKIDDVAWSAQSGILGTPQGFGANVVLPNDTSVAAASVLTSRQPVSVRVVVDANAASVRADIYDQSGTPVAVNRLLYDDGSHGDSAASDRIWSNDGSVPAEPTYTIVTSDPQGTGWTVRAFARDASIASSGAANNGLALRPGQAAAPVVQANYFNVDEQIFGVVFTTLTVTQTSVSLRDPINDAVLPKSIPGAWVEYTLVVSNQGPGAVDTDSVYVVDQLPTAVALCVSAVCVGGDPIAFDDSASPVPTGLTFDYASHVTYSTDGVAFAYTPVPDAEGFDSAISHVRVAPAGAMNAPGPGGEPSFELRYIVRM